MSDAEGRADTRLLGAGASRAFYPLFYVEGLQSASLFHLSQAYGLRWAFTLVAVLVVGLSFVLRAIGDIGDGTVSDMVWARPAVTVLGIDCPPVVGSAAAIQPHARSAVGEVEDHAHHRPVRIHARRPVAEVALRVR